MPRDTHYEPEAPYQVSYPGWEDVFQPIEAKTAAGLRFAEASTLHELLGLALDDFEVVSRDPRYVINLNVWHRSADDGACLVCLGGSVIAGSLAAPVGDNLKYDDFAGPIADRLEALDSLRQGHVVDALHHIARASVHRQLDAERLSNEFYPRLRAHSICHTPLRDSNIEHFIGVMRELQDALEMAEL